MKVNSSVIIAFVVGAAIASLPYTLSSGKTMAQGAGPNSGGGQGQGFPPQQGGGPGFPGQGQGFQGQGQGFPGAGQQRPVGSPMVNAMTTSGNWLFVSAGDTIYKIAIDSMTIVGQTKLPAPRPQQFGGQAGAGGRPNNNGGGQSRAGNLGGALNGNGNGSIPPNK